ncbi:MAG: YfhO family protein [Myxococcota bacterium]|nr:YfhO family protein [Myxococcota bacterium]
MLPGYLKWVKSVSNVWLLIGLLLLPLLYFPGVVLRGEVVSAQDHLSVHAVFQEEAGGEVAHPALSDPAVQFTAINQRVLDSWRSGNAPLWNPDIYAGAPLLANAQSRPFSPWVGFQLLFPAGLGQNLGVVWLITWPALGSFLLLRRLGVSVLGGVGGAVACTGLPYLHVWLLHPHASTYVWIPWMVWGLEVLRARGSPIPLTITTVGLMTGGHPETVAHGIAIALIWGIWRCRRLAVLGALGIGGLISAPIWMPILENVARSATLEAHGGNRLQAVQLVDLFWPNFWGHPADGGYRGSGVWADGVLHPGLGALALALVALRRRIGRTLGLAYVLCVFLALAGVPVFNNARLASIGAWFLALMCGIGLGSIPGRWKFLAIAGVLLGNLHARQWDQQALSAERHQLEPAQWSQELAAALNGQSRVLGLETALEPNTTALVGLRDLRGYDLPVSQSWEAYFKNLDPRMIRPSFPVRTIEDRNLGPLTFGAVAVVGSREPLEDLEPLELNSPAPVFLYRMPKPAYRAWIAEGATAVVDQEAAFRQISLDPLARERPAVEGLSRGWSGRSLRPVEVTEHRPEHLEVSVSAVGQELLVLADSWSPGWRAWVDDQERDVLRVGGYFRGVVLEQGDRRVVFRYQPWSWRVGWGLCLLGLALFSTWEVIRARSATHRSP